MSGTRVLRAIVGLALCLQALSCLAADLNTPQCNARRGSAAERMVRGDPEFAMRCFAYGLKIVREATGHDANLLEAEGIFETLLRVNPESAYPLIGYVELKLRKRALTFSLDKGTCSCMSESDDQIHDEAERATRIKPVIPESYVTLGRADLLVGCVACADKSAKSAEKLGVKSPELKMLQSTIAESYGDQSAAQSRLAEALALPSLPAEARTPIHLALARFYARSMKLQDADREFGNAISADPANVIPYVKRAEFILYVRGDAAAAAAAAVAANKIAVTPEARRVAALAEYLAWATEYRGGGEPKNIKRIAQTSFVAADEAFVLGAQYAGLSKIVAAMLDAAVVQNMEARDGRGNTALIAAGLGNNPDAGRLLIARRANINAQNTGGERALSFFIVNGNRDVAMSLLKAGAEVNYVDKNGSSPLFLAVQQRDAVLVSELLRRKARVPAAGTWSAGDLLAVAATNDDADTLKALLDSGIKVDSPDRRGRPALLSAVYWGRNSAVRLLLERGARPGDAKDIARESGNREILQMLEAAGKRAI